MKVAVLFFAALPALCFAQATSSYDPWFGTTIKSKPHKSAVETLKEDWKKSMPEASLGERLEMSGLAEATTGKGARLGVDATHSKATSRDRAVAP